MLLGSYAPEATWRYAERYLGAGTRTYSPFAADLEISPAYHPQHGAPSFVVPTFWLEPQHGAWLSNRIVSPLPPLYRDGASMLLPVHPEALATPDLPGREVLCDARPGPPLEVEPSANARTVFVRRIDGGEVAPHFVKLHYPKRLSRFTRRLRRPIIELQLWVADELARVGAPLLPEVAGAVLGHDPVEAWGFLARDTRVLDSDDGADSDDLTYTVPLFALYGRDVHAPDDPTLLEQLIARSGQDAGTWVSRHLVEPLVRLWCDVLLRTGCAIELHGQNTLLRFAADGSHSRLAYRDCAVYVDPALRAAQGLTGALPPRNVISRDVRQPRAQVLSLVYDRFLGTHTLDYVARLVRQRFGTDPTVLHRHASDVFADAAGGQDLLPSTVAYYDDRLYDDGGWELVDTGETPRWR
jgi:hypothetical protein